MHQDLIVLDHFNHLVALFQTHRWTIWRVTTSERVATGRRLATDNSKPSKRSLRGLTIRTLSQEKNWQKERA